jgi:hypothetical protein
MNKIKIVCTSEQVKAIKTGACVGDYNGEYCRTILNCTDCSFHPENIEFVIKESED